MRVATVCQVYWARTCSRPLRPISASLMGSERSWVSFHGEVRDGASFYESSGAAWGYGSRRGPRRR